MKLKNCLALSFLFILGSILSCTNKDTAPEDSTKAAKEVNNQLGRNVWMNYNPDL